MMRKILALLLCLLSPLFSSNEIEHLIVIFQENWSFDGLYGAFPNVNGLSQASSESKTQVDLLGNPFKVLPLFEHFLPNQPFDLNPYIPMQKKTPDLLHRFYQEQMQIADGKMNRFVLWSGAGALAVSYYDISKTTMGQLAQEYVICDNWFHSCFGGSMCGALWLFSAQMPVWPNAASKIIAALDPSGSLKRDGLVSPEGYAINDTQPFYPPHMKGVPDLLRVPPQTAITIGDKLSEKGISWGWYAEGWDDALAGNPDPTFPFHHQAPAYFKQFAPGTAARKEHLFDLKQFYASLDAGTLPAVSFIRSLNTHSEHPGYTGVLEGLNWCSDLVKKIQQSSSWDNCLIIVTYDENGGRWDHVAPPVIDQFGPGTRVPAVIISPFAKRNYVDHTQYETVSILKFIEERWNLTPCSSRDASANNILNALQKTE